MNWLVWGAYELRYLLGRAPWDTGITPPEVQRFLDSHPPGRALDIGCGSGTNCLTLAARGWEVTGLDFSLGAIRRARTRAARVNPPIEFRRGDVRALAEIDGPFDLALDIGCFHGLGPAQRERYAGDLARLVRPGGAFLLYGFLSDGDAGEVHAIGQAEPERRFGAAFEVLEITRGTDRQRPSAWFDLRRNAG